MKKKFLTTAIALTLAVTNLLSLSACHSTGRAGKTTAVSQGAITEAGVMASSASRASGDNKNITGSAVSPANISSEEAQLIEFQKISSPKTSEDSLFCNSHGTYAIEKRDGLSYLLFYDATKIKPDKTCNSLYGLKNFTGIDESDSNAPVYELLYVDDEKIYFLAVTAFRKWDTCGDKAVLYCLTLDPGTPTPLPCRAEKLFESDEFDCFITKANGYAYYAADGNIFRYKINTGKTDALQKKRASAVKVVSSSDMRALFDKGKIYYDSEGQLLEADLNKWTIRNIDSQRDKRAEKDSKEKYISPSFIGGSIQDNKLTLAYDLNEIYCYDLTTKQKLTICSSDSILTRLDKILEDLSYSCVGTGVSICGFWHQKKRLYFQIRVSLNEEYPYYQYYVLSTKAGQENNEKTINIEKSLSDLMDSDYQDHSNGFVCHMKNGIWLIRFGKTPEKNRTDDSSGYFISYDSSTNKKEDFRSKDHPIKLAKIGWSENRIFPR